jgi:hypothetical protein
VRIFCESDSEEKVDAVLRKFTKIVKASSA